MRILIVTATCLVACVAAGTGCACFCPGNSERDHRSGHERSAAGMPDRDGRTVAGRAGGGPPPTAWGYDEARARNAGRIAYDAPTTVVPARTPSAAAPAAPRATEGGVVRQDGPGASPTAPATGEDNADTRCTVAIRKRIADAKLSANAQNAKVLTVDGRVTLRGTVDSQAERDAILAIARDVAGDRNVNDFLEVVMAR